MSHLKLVTLVVRNYDPAIAFFVNVLEFDLIEDIPSMTNDGRPKRWVVVHPRSGATGDSPGAGGRNLDEADGQTRQPIESLFNFAIEEPGAAYSREATLVLDCVPT